jgi:hypothetical protein
MSRGRHGKDPGLDGGGFYTTEARSGNIVSGHTRVEVSVRTAVSKTIPLVEQFFSKLFAISSAGD